MEIDEENEEESENEENEDNEDNDNDGIEEEKARKGIEKEVNTKKQNFLLSMEVLSHIEKLFNNDCGLVSLFFGNMIYNPTSKYQISIISSGINIFFIKDLIVPPNRFRPENAVGGDENYCHYQTSAYRKILSLDNDIKELSKKINEGKEHTLKEDDITIMNNNESKKKENKNTKAITQKTFFEDLVNKCVQLQAAINTLFDSSKGL